MAIPPPNSASAFFTLAVLAALAAYCDADYILYNLYNGEVLMAGQNLTNGPHQLAMHTNWDLGLYNNGKPTWRANMNH